MPNTASSVVGANAGFGASGLSKTPSGVASTSNRVPGTQARSFRSAAGSTNWPLADISVVIMAISK
jgi:hypothetical protein